MSELGIPQGVRTLSYRQQVQTITTVFGLFNMVKLTTATLEVDQTGVTTYEIDSPTVYITITSTNLNLNT